MLETIQIFDETALLWIQETVRQAWLDPLVEFYTTLGNGGLLWIVLSLALLCWRPTRKVGAAALLALLLGALCTNVVLKNLVQRPRPYTVVEGLIPLLTSGDPNSFPSGHTCAAFAAGLAWAGTCSARWARIAAVVSAVCMGLSRLYVGVHAQIENPARSVCYRPGRLLFGAGFNSARRLGPGRTPRCRKRWTRPPHPTGPKVGRIHGRTSPSER